MKTILCYGDSNTYGRIPGTTNGRFTKEKRWTGILQNELGADYYVIEEGLGGRTTVFADPIERHMSGIEYLQPCLDSHKPLDLVIISLGTNDLKARYASSAFDLSISMEDIIKLIQKSDAGIEGRNPKVLLAASIPIRDIGNSELNQMFEGGVEKCKILPQYLCKIAKKYNIEYLEPGAVISTSNADGLHIDEEGHKMMAKLIIEKIRAIF